MAAAEQLPNLNVGSRYASEDSPAIPEFLVERISIDHQRWLEVTCQRGQCKRMFMVRPSWLKVGEFITRPCPYCYKAGKVPKKMRR